MLLKCDVKTTHEITSYSVTVNCYEQRCHCNLSINNNNNNTDNNNKTYYIIGWTREHTMKEDNDISQEAGTKNILRWSKLMPRLTDDGVNNV